MKSMTKITKALFWTCLIVLLIFAVVGNVGAQQACVPPPADLVSWWPGDGDANDVRGGNNGQLMNETTFADGKIGQAFSFDGIDDYVWVGNPDNLKLSQGEYTVDAWVNFTSLNAPAEYGLCYGPGCDMTIVSKMGFDQYRQANRNGWRLLKQSDNRIWFMVGASDYGAGPPWPNMLWSISPVIEGTWYHVAATKTQDTIALYVNGVLQESKPLPSNYRDDDTSDVEIGRYVAEPPATMYGLIDEVEIFARALSQEEIQAIYNAGTTGKCKIEVGIDIKPGGDPNSINLKSKGVVAVAILTSAEFDVSTVDPTSVRFADALPIKWAIENVDYDGDMDMLLHFNTQELNLDANSTEATLTGMTFDGTPFSGTDSVRIVRSLPPPSCVRPPAGLISWWLGEDGVDSVGPNNGILQGGISKEPGMVGLAFSFDGGDGYVEATDIGLPMGSAPRTLEMWVKPAFDARVPFIYGNFEAGDAYYAIVEGPNACIGQWANPSAERCGKTDVTDGKWHHLALTYDGAIARLYVDGVLEVVKKKAYATTSIGRAYIGSTGGVSDDYFKGLVDEVTVYNRALTSSEIRAIFASGSAGKCLPVAKCFPPPAGLTGWWPGDGNTDDIIGGRNAVLRGDAITGLGLADQAFILDGDGDFVDVPDDEALNVGTGDFTVDLWVFFNDTAGEQILVEKWIQGGDEVPSQGWTLTKLDDNVLLLAMSDIISGEGMGVASDVLPIPTGTWTHFAATRQGNQVTLFMNGAPIAQGESSLNLDSSSSLKFGHRGNPTDTPGSVDEGGYFLNGRIDEVELFVGQALTHDQIQAIFNARSAGKCKE